MNKSKKLMKYILFGGIIVILFIVGVIVLSTIAQGKNSMPPKTVSGIITESKGHDIKVKIVSSDVNEYDIISYFYSGNVISASIDEYSPISSDELKINDIVKLEFAKKYININGNNVYISNAIISETERNTEDGSLSQPCSE